MYTSNLSTTLNHESQDERQREKNFSIWRRGNGQDRIEYTKRCPSCGGELIWLPEKFGEIQQPSGPGPPAYSSQSKELYQNSTESHYQESPVKASAIGYSESGTVLHEGYRLSDYYRSASRDRFTTGGGGRGREEEYAVANREYQDPQSSYQHRTHRQNSQRGRGDTRVGSHRDTDYYHRNTHSGAGNYAGTCSYGPNYDIKDPLNGGWYCNNCGLHLMSNDQLQSHNMESVETKEEPEQNASPMDSDDKQESPGEKANKSIDEEYVIWENQINKDFSEFLTHIKNYFTEKENKLKEYQVDLCQREKSLLANEGYFKDRIETLKTAEEEFQDKVERLNLQVQDRMQRLREYEAKITRLSNVKKNKTKEASVQTQASFHYDHSQSRHSPYSGQHRPTNENYGFSIGYQLVNNKGASPQPQQPPSTFEERRKRLLEGAAARNSGNSDDKQVNNHVKSNSGVPDGDYMFMGAVNKTSPVEIAGSPYYIDLQQVQHQGNNAHLHNGDVSSHRPEHSTMNGAHDMYVDTSNSNNVADSGFNTPDANFDKTNNHYTYSDHDHQAPAKTSHVVRPRDRKQVRGNVSNNSNNTTADIHSTNSGSARNSVSEYGGERAILVKSPNGVESYTTRAQRYSNSGVHRSSSLPQNKTNELSPSPIQRSRSPSPDSNRARSVPPDQGTLTGYEYGNSNDISSRVMSESNTLDHHDAHVDEHIPPDLQQRSRSSSFGAKIEPGPNHRNTISSPSPDAMASTSMRLSRDRQTVKADQEIGKPERQLDIDTDFHDSSNSKVGLRSRSSESVRRSHPLNKYHHHHRGASYGEIKKKAQSEVNLSSEKWTNEEDDEGIVINHRKSTSFDSPRSKSGYMMEHTYHSSTVHTVSDPKITETLTVEVKKVQEKAQENGNRYEAPAEGNNLSTHATAGTSVHSNGTEKNYYAHKTQKNYPEPLNPVRQDQVYENIKSVPRKHVAESQISSQTDQKARIRGRRSDMSIPHRRLNKVSHYTASGTQLNQNSFDSSDASVTESFQQRQKYHKDQITARSIRPGHSPAVPQYNSASVAVVNYHPVSKSNPETPANQSGLAKRHPQKPVHLQSTSDRHSNHLFTETDKTRTTTRGRLNNNDAGGDRDEGIFVDVSNDRANESPEMTSTPVGHVSDHMPGNVTHHAEKSVNSLKESSTSHQGPKPPQRLYYNTKSSDMNGKIDLTDKNNWAIRRRRDQQKSRISESHVTRPGYAAKETLINGVQGSSYYENVSHPLHSTKEDPLKSRSLHRRDMRQKEGQQSQHHRIGNSEKYPDAGYPQQLPDKSNDRLSYHEYERRAQSTENHKMTQNPGMESTNGDSPEKKKLFGFSPRYKDILFKYGSGGKQKSGKPSGNKGEDKNNNNNSIDLTSSKGSSKPSAKKGSPKAKESSRPYKDGRDTMPLSPKSKLPQYNNYVKEMTSK